MPDKNEEVTANTTKWKCPECGQKLTLFVAPSQAPTCANPEVHPKKIAVMVPAGKK